MTGHPSHRRPLPRATRRRGRSLLTRFVLIGGAILGLVAAVLYFDVLSPSQPPPPDASPEPVPDPSGAFLELGEWDWQRTANGDYVEARGQVTNISGERIKDVVVMVSFFRGDGAFVASGDSLIDLNPILPGQTSTWSILERHNSSMATARVEFRKFGSGTIRHQTRK